MEYIAGRIVKFTWVFQPNQSSVESVLYNSNSIAAALMSAVTRGDSGGIHLRYPLRYFSYVE